MSLTDASPPPLRVHADDPQYQRQSAAEGEFWRTMHPAGLEALDGRNAVGPIDRYVNRRFTGDGEVRWYERIAARGTFRRGACLGTSSLQLEEAILARNPSLHLTFFEISEGALARRERAFAQRFAGRTAFRVADLNFVTLGDAQFDLIVSSSTVHHVTNLEHLAWQINRGLTDDGYFFLEDYVGEPRFQFSAEKRRVYGEVFNRDRIRSGAPPSDLTWLDPSDLSPFCGVRSNEILDVFRRSLFEEDLRTAATLTVPILRSRAVSDAPNSPWVSDRWVRDGGMWRLMKGAARRLFLGRFPSSQTMLPDAFLHELYLLGDVLADAGLLAPGIAFATYRRKS
jgi:SAM-dependent methyltransferase